MFIAPWVCLSLLTRSYAGEVGVDDSWLSADFVHGDQAFKQVSPDVAWSPDSQIYLVVWYGELNPTGDGDFEIWGQLVDLDGRPVGSNFQISDQGPSRVAMNPAVAHNAFADEFFVVWEGDAVPGESEIFGRRVSATGAPLGGPQRLTTYDDDGDTFWDAHSPRVVYVPPDDAYVVAFQGSVYSGGIAELFLQRVEASGLPSGPELLAISFGPGGDPSYGIEQPDIAWDPLAEELLVLGRSLAGSVVATGITGQRFDRFLNPLGGQVTVHTPADGGASRPRVAHDPLEGAFVVTYGTDGGGMVGDFEARVVRVAPDGTSGASWRSSVGAPGSTFYDVFFPDLEVTLEGQVVVVWSGRAGAWFEPVDHSTEVFLQILGNDLLPVEPLQRVSTMGQPGTGPGNVTEAAVGLAPGVSRALIVWEGYDTDLVVLGEYEIFGQAYEFSGILAACFGDRAIGDDDGDGWCDDLDLCLGDDRTGDNDGDGVCNDEDLGLTVSALLPGSPLSLRVVGAPPGAEALFYATLSGLGNEPCLAGVCGDLNAPVRIGRVTVDTFGNADVVVVAPGTLARGARAVFQAVVRDGPMGDTTPIVVRRVP